MQCAMHVMDPWRTCDEDVARKKGHFCTLVDVTAVSIGYSEGIAIMHELEGGVEGDGGCAIRCCRDCKR